MVKLIVDSGQISILETSLINAGIDYELKWANTTVKPPYLLKPPYLIVDGVPLDYNRSMKWIEIYKNMEEADIGQENI